MSGFLNWVGFIPFDALVRSTIATNLGKLNHKIMANQPGCTRRSATPVCVLHHLQA